MEYQQYQHGSGKMIDKNNNEQDTLDHVTGGYKNIETDHYYIHEGVFYEASLQFTLSAGGTKHIQIITDATLYMHYRPSKISANADNLLEV